MLLKKILSNKMMKRAYLSWLFVSLFFLYQYILRVTPGVMFDQLKIAFNIRAEEFSTLGAFYLFSYSLMQVPMGIMVDRWGVRKTILLSVTLCVFGTFLFSYANYFFIAQFSRILIGIGSSAAFICALKLVSDHFAPGQRGVLMGMTLTMGAIGAIITGGFINTVIENYSGRYVVIFSGIIGIALYFVLSFVLQKDENDKQVRLDRSPFTNIPKKVFNIFKNRYVLKYSILSIALYTPLSVIADLWGTAFLQQKYNLSQEIASNITLSIYFGMAVGSIFFPWFGEKNKKLDQCIYLSIAAMTILFGMIIYGNGFSVYTLFALFILVGFFCGGEMCCFTRVLQFVKKENSGEVIGCMNTFNMLGGAILQQIIGYNLDKNWAGGFDIKGIRIYTAENFEMSLGVLLIVIVACGALAFLLKVTNKDSI